MYKIRKTSLNYDVYPKIAPVEKNTKITIRPLGSQAAFATDGSITVSLLEMNTGTEEKTEFHIDEDGSGWFEYAFNREGQYDIKLRRNDSTYQRLSVYAVEKDLYGKYAYIGDLHIHSNCSDGRQAPAVVAANYRKFGYDFLAVTDHHVYFGSLEAINAYKDVPLDLALFTGEEVHLPGNYVHIINFGGEYSVNGLITESEQCRRRGTESFWRSAVGKTAPDTISETEYRRQVEELADTLDIPDDVDRFPYAASVWAFRRIKEANGLSLFCHPYWISHAFQISETFTRFMLKNHPFDAFEVLGGEEYYEQNGFQTARYYDDKANGIDYAVVGTTDSHDSTELNSGAYVARTMVFAESMEHDTLINAIKNKYSVAFDGVANQFVGDNRLIRYAWFLMQNYFPIHDELCFEEGRLMKEYVTGSKDEREDAQVSLEFIYGRMDKLRKKYFGY